MNAEYILRSDQDRYAKFMSKNRYMDMKIEEDIPKIPKLKFGDWFLLSIYGNDGVSYPQLGVFHKFSVADMALTMEWIQPTRTWMHHTEFMSNADPKSTYHMPLSDAEPMIHHHHEWYNMMIVYDVWKSRPVFTEMLRAYRKTHYFRK